VGAADFWRPWRRRSGLKAELVSAAEALRAARLSTVRGRLSPKSV
jgi:hypothetical protein